MSTLLGIPDKRIEKSQTTFSINKIGGKPDWLMKGCQIPLCSLCKQVMYLAVQLYCPLDGSPFHRNIYLFSCINRHCWNKHGSWKAVRSQLQEESFASTTKNTQEVADEWKSGGDDWGTDVNDWGTEADDWGTDVNDWGSHNNDLGATGEVWETDELGESSHFLQSKSENVFDCKMESSLSEDSKDHTGDFSLENCQTDIDLKMDHMHLDDSKDRVSPETVSIVTEQGVNEMMSLLVTKDNIGKSYNTSDNTTDFIQVIAEDAEKYDSVELEAYFLNVIEEYFTGETDDWHIHKMLKDYQKREGVNVEEMAYQQYSCGKGESAMGKETYEKEDIVHGDRYFYKFTKKISAVPQQCVRYCWDGKPVFISAPDSKQTSSKACVYCGQKCVYELQLMPALVNLLHRKDKPGPTTEFGTVIVYSCSASCWDIKDLYKEETVYLQPDPDNHLFRV